MKFNKFLFKTKKMSKTMIGFKIDNIYFKKIENFMKNILNNKNIKYEDIKEKHITIAQITGKYDKDDLVRDVNIIKTNIIFKPKGIEIFKGINTNYDYIVLEYKTNTKFLNIYKRLSAKYNIKTFDKGPRAHISILRIERDSNLSIKDLQQHIKFPTVRPSSIELFNSSFEVEYEKED
jgi:hypothetical protein